jgi:hypothetical protein
VSPRLSKRVSVPRSKHQDYIHVADSFYAGAETAKAFEYWNAAGVLIVHAAIAYSDAITIRVGGVKSRGEDHMAVIDLVRHVVALDKAGDAALNHLWRMIQEKNLVSYSGEVYSRQEVDKLWKHLERYRTWALSVLGR